MSCAAGLARVAAVAILAAGYACLAHYSNTSRNRDAGIVIALMPLAVAMLAMGWQARRRPLVLGLFAVICGGTALAWPFLQRHYSMIYWIEHVVTQMLLCLMFARTLAPGREPLCTYFARMVHGSLDMEIENYTRRLTRIWAMFFAAVAATSSALFFGATLTTWSTFAYFFTGPLVGLMFVIEYIVRRRLLPQMEHANILAGIQAFWKAPARQ
jgi:uncharacterized membrane protein